MEFILRIKEKETCLTLQEHDDDDDDDDDKVVPCIRQKTGAQNIVKEIKQYREKWLQHVQKYGHKQTTKTSTAI